MDKAYEFAQTKSLKVVFDLVSEDWGQKHFCIADPNGLVLDIVESFEPEDEYKADYLV